MRTLVYVDAFNLYFGSLKGGPHKWLNIVALCAKQLKPHHQIVGLKYFTAKVQPRPNDPGQPQRQEAYLRALSTVPGTEIILGHYLTKTVRMPLANPSVGGPATIEVIRTEEKGSDVNLAVSLVHDGHLNRYDCAVIISGDSDLLAPVKLVMTELGKPVGVLNPQQRPCRVLMRQATFYQHLRPNFIAVSQFPAQMQDSTGAFTKPKSW